MPLFIYMIVGLVVVGSIVGFSLFVYSRRVLREAKNYERGLKMVPLLIHLPPLSEDIDANGRDNRDIVEENISKAQVLYGIIASTAQKGFKSKFYGQRHISFEIVANDGFVHFYTAVPMALVSVVEQAIVSAYPSARLEEVAEHNIFSPVGKISATTGGELVLKEHFSYPIATYQDLKRDPLQAFLNAFSKLEKEDGAAIQLLIRPARSDWRKISHRVSGDKRKGKKKGGDASSWVKQLGSALVKPPETKDSKSEPVTLSSIEQSTVEAMEDKTRYPGFEVAIRVMASSNILQRSQAVLANIVAGFSLMDSQGKNGFKFLPAKDIESFVTAFIMRFFPPSQQKNILNSVEVATLFHFPDQSSIPTTQVERQMSKQSDGPRNIPDEGLLLGYNIFRGAKKPIRISDNDRRRHIYVVGQTGVGKSWLLENMALQDMLSGRGFAFVDPHGDTAETLLSMVPKERTEDVIYFCPADMEYPLGLNLFEYRNPDQKDFLIQETINMLVKLYDPGNTGIIGPRYEHIFRNCALLLMADPEGGTFIDIPKLLIDENFAKSKLKYVTDQTLLDFWTKELPNSRRSNEAGEVTSWVVSKFGAFLQNEMMRNIIGQNKSSFDLRDIMDKKKILLVNLSKGRTGDLNSKLLGMIFVMKFQAAAMSRADMHEDEREDFSLYVDEFQNFSTDSFATILSEARKYRLNLIVANQFTTQLTDEIREAVFGNVGTIVAFRIGQNDAEPLTKYFQPVFDGDDLLRIPNANTVVRTLIGGVPTQPFSMATIPRLGKPNPRLGEAIKQLSAAKYARPRAVVEAEIFKRLTVEEPPKPAFGAPFGPSASQPPSFGPQSPLPATSPKSMAPPSFLDEWLTKKKQTPAPSPAQTAVKQHQPQVANQARPIASPKPSIPATPAKPPLVQQNEKPKTVADDRPRSLAEELRMSLAKQQTEKIKPKADDHLEHDDTIKIQ